MADVANCMKSSTPCKANFGQILSDAADDILSPEVREAMDRIFPQSASQFLQGGLSFEEPFLGVASNGADRDKQLATLPFASAGSPNFAALTSMATTKNSMEPPVAVSAGAVKSFFEHNLAVTAMSSAADLQIGAVQVNTWLAKEDTVETESRPTELPNRMPSNTRISRADFEIITSCDAGVNDCERAPRSASSDDIVSDNYNSGDGCDSEDMSRPFVSITREKKRKRRKKMQPELHTPAKSVSYLSEHNVNSGDEFKTSSKTWNNYNNLAVVNGSGECVRAMLENSFTAEGIIQNEKSTTRDLSSKSIQDCNPDNYSSGSNAYNLDICPVKDLYKDSMTASEEISNTSNSSAKENLLGKKRVPSQKLPKVKREQFHIVRHVNKIKNTFPPCCVVLRKIRTRRVHNVNNVNGVDNVIPLVERVRCLKHLCDKGYLVCKKNRKVRLAEKLGYMNVLEEPLLHGASDDEFEKPQKRSLRKRANISYVEPGEDDIGEEVSSKRSRAKSKDESVDKVSDVSYETEGSDNKNRYYKHAHVESNSNGICNKEQFGYPPSSMNSTAVYNPNSAEMNISDPSQHMLYSPLNSHHSSMVPYLSYLSGLSGGTVFPPYVPRFFPPMPTNISGSLPSHSYIQQEPYSYPVSNMEPDLMATNAKDFYMQLLSSGMVGAGGLESSAGLPADKSVGIPPRPMFSQPMPQVSSASFTTQAMFRPPVPVASVSHGSMMLPTSLHMSSLYGLPLLNRSQQTSSHSIPPASLPLTSSSHGHMNMAAVTPTRYTSYGSSSSTTCSSAPTTALASSRNSTFITSASSSMKAVPVSFAPMPVSYISSIHNSMPNQSSHPRLAHASDLQSKLPTSPGHGLVRFTSHGSAGLTNHGLDRFAGHGSDRFAGYGSERSASQGPDSRFPSHGSDRFAGDGSERSVGQVPDRFANHGSERFASLSNLSTQSRMSTMQSHIAERLSAMPSQISQSRTCNITGPISQSNIPSPVSQPRYNSPSPIAQSGSYIPGSIAQSGSYIPGSIAQSGSYIPGSIAQSGSYIPGSIAQSGSYIPSPVAQSRAYIPSSIAQSGSCIPSSIAQSGSYIPGSNAQSGSYKPGPIAQSSSNIPNPIVQSRSNIPSHSSQSRSNIPSPSSQSRSNIPSPSSQARSYIASLIAETRSKIPGPIAQSGANIPSPIVQSRSNIPSASSQSRSNIASPSSQAGSYIASPSSQARSYIASLIAETRSRIPSPIAQSRSNIPSPSSQSRSDIPSPSSVSRSNIPSPSSQSRSNIQSLMSQSRSDIQNLISQSRSDIPSPISQTRIPNIASPCSQSRIPNLPNPISQSRSNMPSPFSQLQAPSQSSQPATNNISADLTGLPSPNWIQRFPKHPVSACPVRTVIPGDTSTIASGCLATLSNSASSGQPNSELPAANVVLPQHKKQSDQKLHDQRAVKRRKLEQKYPLPPGVVIKTERLDSPHEQPSVSNTPQSLLSHNSHLIYTSSTAADCQPSSRLPLITAYPPTTQSSLTDHSTISTYDALNYTTSSAAATLNPPKAPVITSVESSALLDIANRPPLSPGQVLPPSAPSAKAPAVTDKPKSQDLQQCPSPRAAALSSFKNSLTELQMFVQAQAACGLRADRLEQLRGLLYKKQEQYKALQKFIESNSSDYGNRRTEGVGGDTNSVLEEQRGGSEAEPFVID